MTLMFLMTILGLKKDVETRDFSSHNYALLLVLFFQVAELELPSTSVFHPVVTFSSN